MQEMIIIIISEVNGVPKWVGATLSIAPQSCSATGAPPQLVALLAPLAIRALAEVGTAEAKPAIKTVVHGPGGSNGGAGFHWV